MVFKYKSHQHKYNQIWYFYTKMNANIIIIIIIINALNEAILVEVEPSLNQVCWIIYMQRMNNKLYK